MSASDLSGEQIDADEATKMICSLSDGRRRELIVRADEAERIGSAGTNVTRVRDRVWAWWKRNWKKAAFWAVGIFVTSLVLPAITKQWSDRQQAIAVKSQLMTDVSTAASSAFNSAMEIAQGKSRKPAEMRSKAEAAWIVSEGSIDPRYHVYFPGTDAGLAWGNYRFAMVDYLAAACCDAKHRKGDVEWLHNYVGNPHAPRDVNEPWSVLRCGPKEGCPLDPSYPDAYRWLGLAVLRQRARLLDGLMNTRPAGFSGGWQDFIHDTFAPLGA